MPAPTFELVTRGTAPNQYAQESDLEGAVNAALAALWADVTAAGGKQFTSRAQAASAGQAALPTALGMIVTMENGVITYRVPNSSTDDPLFPGVTAPYWGVSHRVNVADVPVTVTNVRGEANAILADLPFGPIANGMTLILTPTATNTGPVTATIGGVPYAIHSGTSFLSGGELIAGAPVMLRRISGTALRLIGASTGQANALAARVAAVEPILRTVINTDGTPARTLTLYTTPGFDITLNPNGEGGIISGVPPSGGNGAPVNTRVTTRRRGDTVVMTWYDATGRIYERVYASGAWGAWVELTRWNNAQYQTINLSGQGLAARDLNLCITPGITWTGDGSSLVYNCPLEIDDQGGTVDGTALFNGTLQAVPMGAKIAQYYWDARKGQDSPFVRWYDIATATFSRWRYLLRPAVIGPILVDLGDSIQAGVGPGASNSVPAQAAALVGGTLTNLGVSGRMMCGTTAGDLIPQIDAPANAAAIASATIITIAYGTNDWNGGVPIGTETDTVNGTFYGAMAAGLSKIRALNPTAKIAFAVPIYRGKAYSNPKDWTEAGAHSGSGLLVEDYRRAIRRFSAIHGLPVLEMSHNFAINAVSAPTYLPDCLHPDIAGAALMAEWRVAQWVAWKWAVRV